MGRYSSETQRPPTFTLNQQHPLAQGLVFAGLGAHAGSTRYHDSSVYGNTGTLTNMEPATDWVWDATLNRMALDLVGSSTQRVVMTRPALLSVPCTISAWFKTADATNIQTIACVNDGLDGTVNNGLFLDVNRGTAGRVTAFTLSNGTALTAVSTSAFSTTTWNHGSAVFAGIASRVSVLNGTPGTANTTSGTTPAIDATFIGFTGTARYFTGRVGDVLIHARALSASESQQLADPSNVMLSGLLQPPRRKWWPVVSGAAPTFKAAWATKRRQTIGGGVI